VCCAKPGHGLTGMETGPGTTPSQEIGQLAVLIVVVQQQIAGLDHVDRVDAVWLSTLSPSGMITV
jgi:hypothetical protein